MPKRTKRRPQKSAKKGAGFKLGPHFDVWVQRRGKRRHKIAVPTQKREAIRIARRAAYGAPPQYKHPRQVSVYTHNAGRPTLLYQVHYSPKLGRLIAEEL